MSNEAINWAFKQNLPMNEKFVLVALADYADEGWSCYPSYQKTAERVGCSRATVIRLTAKLTERGYLRTERRERGNKSARSNRYYLSEGGINLQPGGVELQPGGCTGATRGGCTDATPLTITKIPEQNPDDFSAFWSAYPATQKGSKKAAESKYRGLLKKMSHDDLMARLEHYKRTRQRQQRSNEFVPNVPHATTWLNQERWNDYGEFDPTTATTGPESLTVEEVNEAVGPTNWAPPEPEQPPADQAAWLREQYAEHHRQRQYQAWEVINGKAG